MSLGGVRARRLGAILALSAAVLGVVVGGTTAVDRRLSGDVVRVTGGEVLGRVDGPVRRFAGIPFAAPPVGPQRWTPPAPVLPWQGVRDATRPGPVCEQPRPGVTLGMPVSEDCLFLNVHTPAMPPRQPCPVLVWLHGGGFTGGSGSDYDPERLVTRGDLIVVTVNYRLGIFGALTHPALGRDGSFALQDQQAALRWVQANIAAFGGDPGNVTLAGGSAGALSACSHLDSPSAAGLFHKAVIASGSCLTNFPAGALAPGLPALSSWRSRTDVNNIAQATATDLGCTDPEPAAAVACLRALPAAELTASAWWPVYAFIPFGTDVLPDEPARALRRNWICPTIEANRVYARTAPVWTYLFADPGATPLEGPLPLELQPATTHGSDVPYLFWTHDDHFGLTPRQRALGDQMVDYWTRFARTGNPNGKGLPIWPRTIAADVPTLRLAPGDIGPVDLLTQHHCRFWRTI